MTNTISASFFLSFFYFCFCYNFFDSPGVIFLVFIYLITFYQSLSSIFRLAIILEKCSLFNICLPFFIFLLLLPKYSSSYHTIFCRSCLSDTISLLSSTITRPATQNPVKYEMLSCPPNRTTHHRRHKTSMEN